MKRAKIQKKTGFLIGDIEYYLKISNIM